MLDWLFARGHAADVVLAVMVLEWIGLVAWAGWDKRLTLFRLLPGALMILALRGALTGADWQWIALPLLLSFPVHIIDLMATQRRGT